MSDREPEMIKDMTDAELIEHYWALRTMIARGAEAKNPRIGRMMRDLDITVAIARKRGVTLAR